MIVMGIDTALSHCSIAIVSGAHTLAERCLVLSRGHAERIAPMAKDVCAEADISIRDIDRVGVVVGPGSFAGVRVGVGFARGLRIDGGADVYGVTSLEALAMGAAFVGNEKPIVALIDARNGFYYAGIYGADLSVIVKPFIGKRDEIARSLQDTVPNRSVISCGPAAADFSAVDFLHFETSTQISIDAKNVAAHCGNNSAALRRPTPLYLRPPDAVKSNLGRFSSVS